MSAGQRLPGAPDPTRRWTGAGVEIAGDEWGPADGPAVILLHGGGQTRHSWKGAGVALGRAGYRVIAFDARGHGDSGWSPDADYGRAAMVADLVEICRQLDAPCPALVGASMGGGTSLLAVGEGSLDVSALVLVDIAPRIDPTGVAKIGAFMDQRPDGFATLDEVADAVAAYQPHRTRPRSTAGLAKNLRLTDDGRYRWHWDPAFRSDSGDADQRARQLELAAGRITADTPTLLVRGGLSDILTEAAASSFLELCPHSEYVNVDNVGHMIAGDDNDAFVNAVVSFLRRHIPPTRKEALHGS